MKDVIRIGVLGCAKIADRSIIPTIQSMDEFELVAVASRTLAKAKKYAKKFNCEAIEGYQDLVERDDIDALYIPLPIGLHHEWVVRSLENEKHVLCEKSLAINYESALKMVESARANAKVLMENFMFVHHSQHKFVLDQLKNGEIGEIRCFRSSFGFPPFPKNNIRYIKALGGGALLDAGTYTLKASQFILQEELRVKAAHLTIDPAGDVDLFGGALLTSKSGIITEIAFGFDNYYQCNYEVWGSKGKITSERAFTAGPGIRPRVIIEKQDEKHEFILPEDNHFINIFTHFYNSIVLKKLENNYEELLTQAKLLSETRAHGEQS